jgi:hypothetical protein
MSESKRTWLQIAAAMCFVFGLMLFLKETRSTGEALEVFKLIVSLSTISIVGIALAVVAAAMLIVLYVGGRKETLKHR